VTDSPPDLFVIGANLMLEATAAEVATALGARGIEVVLLRGPALTEWLYGKASPRTSLDVDLLVPPHAFSTAESVMRELGYRCSVDVTPGTEVEHARTWRRPQGATVDLHWTVVGALAPPPDVWQTISSHSQPRALAGGEINVPARGLRLLLVALHAGQHGRDDSRTLGDLNRALEIADTHEWATAVAIAERIDAVELFAAGLRLSPGGSHVAAELGLPSRISLVTALRLPTPIPTATGYGWLASAPGSRARAKLLLFKLFPPAGFMRDWRPLARKGKLGLVLAYLYRPLWLARWALPGYLAWRRARRAARDSERT
jgi:putative nucleotidyltransferase-like protein